MLRVKLLPKYRCAQILNVLGLDKLFNEMEEVFPDNIFGKEFDVTVTDYGHLEILNINSFHNIIIPPYFVANVKEI